MEAAAARSSFSVKGKQVSTYDVIEKSSDRDGDSGWLQTFFNGGDIGLLGVGGDGSSSGGSVLRGTVTRRGDKSVNFFFTMLATEGIANEGREYSRSRGEVVDLAVLDGLLGHGGQMWWC